MSAGPIMPPKAATTGRARRRGLASSPRMISYLISRPTTKKKIAISASFTQSSTGSVSVKAPSWTVKGAWMKSK